jgi:hypothetical protein
MKAVMATRQEIASYWHDRTACRAVLFADNDAFAAFYTTMFLIQDTAEAVDAHMQTGFSSNAMAAYIEFWGVMQALVVQEDAIIELYKSIFGSVPCADDAPLETRGEIARRSADQKYVRDAAMASLDLLVPARDGKTA